MAYGCQKDFFNNSKLLFGNWAIILAVICFCLIYQLILYSNKFKELVDARDTMRNKEKDALTALDDNYKHLGKFKTRNEIIRAKVLIPIFGLFLIIYLVSISIIPIFNKEHEDKMEFKNVSKTPIEALDSQIQIIPIISFDNVKFWCDTLIDTECQIHKEQINDNEISITSKKDVMKERDTINICH
jgi:hypothetical protein